MPETNAGESASATPGRIGGKWMTEAEAAEYLGVKRSNLQMRRHKKLPPAFYRVGRLVKYRIEDLDAFIQPGLQDAGQARVGSGPGGAPVNPSGSCGERRDGQRWDAWDD